jgi:DNA repair exonuclease SbcCD nuclease subunit
MRILITADLHYREQWFRLLSRAAEWDLVCIAGDLLDMFNDEPRIVQARTVSRWIRELAKVNRVAICSGNHDNAGRQIFADHAPMYGRLAVLGKEPRIITDGATEVLGDLIITTASYHCYREQKSVDTTGDERPHQTFRAVHDCSLFCAVDQKKLKLPK